MANSSSPNPSCRLGGMISVLTVLAGVLFGAAAVADNTGVTAGNYADMLPSPLGHYLASRHAEAAGDYGWGRRSAQPVAGRRSR